MNNAIFAIVGVSLLASAGIAHYLTHHLTISWEV